MKLSGNTVLITGGSSGIGLELAKRFLQLGNKVIITGRDALKLKSIRDQFPELSIFTCELAEPVSLNELILFMKEEHPDLNILINNAGIQYNYLFSEQLNADVKIDYEIATNLNAPVKLSVHLLPVLLRNANSAIVNVSSGLAIAPKMTASVYCATKSALHSFTQTLRYQLENTNVNVFEIIPALVETPMTTGRGKSKITPEQLVDEFIRDFERNKWESYIGKAKLLKLLHRLLPHIANRMMKNGL